MWSQVVKKNVKAVDETLALPHMHSGLNSSHLPPVLERWNVAEGSRERDDIQHSLGLPEGTRCGPSLTGLQRLPEPKIEHRDFLKSLELALT